MPSCRVKKIAFHSTNPSQFCLQLFLFFAGWRQVFSAYNHDQEYLSKFRLIWMTLRNKFKKNRKWPEEMLQYWQKINIQHFIFVNFETNNTHTSWGQSYQITTTRVTRVWFNREWIGKDRQSFNKKKYLLICLQNQKFKNE